MPKPLYDQPLYIPQGSVRSILALGIVGAFLAGLIEPDVALVVIGFYFAQRQATVSAERLEEGQ